MRLSRLFAAAPLLALAALLPAPTVARADDTEDFLKPDNWEGRSDLWKIDAKAKTVVGETTEDPKYNTFFCSKKKYGDFEMTCKIQLRDGVGNSGIQIRSKLADAKKFAVHGPQCDIGAGYWGSLYGEGFGGMMKAASKDSQKVIKDKDFNDYYIKCVGKKVTIKINGVTTVDEEFAKMPPEGIIAFQLHAGYKSMEVTFKDIKFKDLSAK